jgi:hypothetical protein
MLVAFYVVAVVRALVGATRTFDDVCGLDLRLASREVREENLFCLALFADETKVPLSGGKRSHAFESSDFTATGERKRGQVSLLYG